MPSGILVVEDSTEYDVNHKVTAFSLGAEDYIEKPFNVLELRARVEAKIKKNAAQEEGQQVLTRGKLHLNSLSQRVHILENEKKTAVLRFGEMNQRFLIALWIVMFPLFEKNWALWPTISSRFQDRATASQAPLIKNLNQPKRT